MLSRKYKSSTIEEGLVFMKPYFHVFESGKAHSIFSHQNIGFGWCISNSL